MPHEYYRKWGKAFSRVAWVMLGHIIDQTNMKSQAPICMEKWKRLTGYSESTIHRGLNELMPRDPGSGARTFTKGITVAQDTGGRACGLDSRGPSLGIEPLYSWDRAAINEYVDSCRASMRADGPKMGVTSDTHCHPKGVTIDTLDLHGRVSPVTPPVDTRPTTDTRTSSPPQFHHHQNDSIEPTDFQVRSMDATQEARTAPGSDQELAGSKSKPFQEGKNENPRWKGTARSAEEARQRIRDVILKSKAGWNVDWLLEQIAKRFRYRDLWIAYCERLEKQTSTPGSVDGGYFLAIAVDVAKEDDAKIMARICEQNGICEPVETERCQQCRGVGRLPDDPLQYCTCPMGRDLKRVEKRRAPGVAKGPTHQAAS